MNFVEYLLARAKYGDLGGGGGGVVTPLEITENGTYTAPEGVDGYNPVTVNVDTSKTWLLKTQGFSGFAANASYDGAYTKNLAFGTDIEAFQITEGQKYVVVWDGTEYETKAEDISTIIPGALMLGNGSGFGLSGNGEPFIVGYGEFGLTLICLTDTEESHNLGIYQKVSAGSCDELKYVTFKSYDGTVEYGKKAVAVGDDCADPIARGLFDTPTRESDAQYNYTFNDWATTPNGAADSGWNKAVTEDRTVYANFSKAVRYYTITFYDSNGTTVLNSTNYAYGSTPNITVSKDGYKLIGWEPKIEKVTGDASYVAQWVESVALEDASWETIANYAESGIASKMFKVGDTKTIICNGYSIKMQIAAFSADTLSDGSGKAGITFISSTLYPMSVAHDTKSDSNFDYYPWSDSSLRTYCNETILSGMDEELKNRIKEVRKYTRGEDFDVETTDEYCWPLSGNEVNCNLLGSSYPPVYTELFPNNSSRIRDSVVWNLRDINAKKMNYYIKTDGAMTYSTGRITARKFLFGFCI